jgi:uncharacterized membrane protein YbhN (UPF0104 family)
MSDPLTSSSKRSRLLRWVGTLLSLGLLIYLLSQQWGEIVGVFQQISTSGIFASLAFTFVSRIAVGSRWHMLLRVTDLKVTWGKTQRLTFAGLFASNFLPTTIGGDVVRLAGAVQLRISGTISAASLVVDRLVGMLGMALVLPFGLVPLWEWFVSHPKLANEPIPGFLMAGTASKFWRRIQDVLKRVWNALALWRARPQSFVTALLFTGLHQISLYVSILILLNDLGESLPIWQIAGLWSFVYFVTLIPISINGYGVQELSLTFFFSQVGGLSAPTALAIAVLVRTIQMLASLPGAAFVPAIMAGARAESANG